MAISRQTRVQYDQIALLYDSQPNRQKAVDQHLLSFLESYLKSTPLTALDLCCGTGNQLVADRQRLPHARLVGLDLSIGMLAQARRKANNILWVQADVPQPPFPAHSFDYITNQFAFHHVRDKALMLTRIYELLRSGGRFVMINLAPREMPGWIYYGYFPGAYTRDLQDLPAPDAIIQMLDQAGFVKITSHRDHTTETRDLAQFLATARRRDTVSQLMCLPDQEYQAGLERIERELAQGHRSAPTESCILTITADKP